MEGGQKESLRRFLADQKIVASSWEKMRFGASCSTGNKLLLVACRILITGLQIFKVGNVKFANSLSPPSIVTKVRTGSKSSQGT